MPWSWRYEGVDGQPVAGPAETFSSQADAESWIGQPVNLIPRMRDWIDDHCPGTGLALTEYRWGADDGPSSALAHAEALAIFGREGVDVATRWVAPEPGTRVVDSFRLFLDYDGAGSRAVGDSVRAASGDVEDVGGTWAQCFAYGSRNGDTLALLAELGCAAGLTTDPRRASRGDSLLELPRIDTNDLRRELAPVPA